MAFLPRERKTEGIFAPLSVIDNITVSCLALAGAIRGRPPVAARLDGQGHGRADQGQDDEPLLPIASLSGGNQQKALLGRLIATRPRVLLLNDPLRGVDLGAKRDLYEVLTAARCRRHRHPLLSTELVELCLLCNRVVVFHDQSVAAVIDRSKLDERTLIAAMFGKMKRHGQSAGASA